MTLQITPPPPTPRKSKGSPQKPQMNINSPQLNIRTTLGSVHILRHHVKGGRGIPDTIDDIDNALKGGGGGNHQNDYVIYSVIICNRVKTFANNLW